MRNLFLTGLLSVFFIIACRQKTSDEQAALRPGEIHTLFDTTGASFAVTEVMNSFSSAYNNADTALLRQLLSDDFLMITGISEHSFFDREEFVLFIKESKDTANMIDLKSPFNYLPGPRKVTIAYTGLAASAQDSLSFLNITKQKMVMNTEHYGAVYLNSFLKKENGKWRIQFISLYPVLKDEFR